MNFLEKYTCCLTCDSKLVFNDLNYYYCNNCYCVDKFIVSEDYIEYNINFYYKPKIRLWYNNRIGLLYFEKLNQSKIEVNCFFEDFDVLKFLEKMKSNEIFE